MSGATLPLHNTPSWRGAQLKEAQGHLYEYKTWSLTLREKHVLRDFGGRVLTGGRWIVEKTA
jgi:hypothetical protein